MHPCFERANALTQAVIGAAIEVHRTLGPGLLEKIYERCLIHELNLNGLKVECQQAVQVRYKDMTFTEELRFDLLVEGVLLVEVKAVASLLPVHKAQIISYLKLLNFPLGLLINFHEVKLVDGLHRLLLPKSNH